MITLTDSLQLAYTKIRTRRVRLFIVLFVSSLLFSGLVAGSLVVSGALGSFQKFSDQGFTGRYIVAGTSADSDSFNRGMQGDPALIARAEALEKDEQARKKVEAKRLGIEYFQDDSQKAVYDDGSGNKSVNTSSLIGSKALAEIEAENPLKIDQARFKQQLGSSATAYYESVRMMPQGGLNRPTLSVIKDGKEETDQKNGGYMFGFTQGVEGVTQDWTAMDKPLLEPFLLEGQSLDIDQNGSIPVIASYSAAQEILKLPKLGIKATNEQKKQRLIDVRKGIAGKTFQICYRNSTSYSDLQTAIQQQEEVKANQNKKDYEKPSYITTPSETPCAAPVVQRDTRTADEKKLFTKQAEFDRLFGKSDPSAQVLTFRIVGISSDREIPTGFNVTQILGSLLASNVGANWASPIDVLDKVPAAADIFREDPQMTQYQPQRTYYAEYTNADAARVVLKNDSCVVTYPGIQLEEGQVSCSRKTKPFILQTFGSTSLAIDEFKDGFRKVQLIFAVIVGVIASVILMGMVGRIIADARKETAVFRALGASRLSIAQIYVTYTIYLAVLTIVIALILGFGIALWVDSQFSPDMSINMALLFNVPDLSQQFHFYGLDAYDVGLISAVILGASVLGSIIPIAHNVRRNPIKDMREE